MKKANEQFSKWYYSLKYSEIKEVRKSICKACFISCTVFYNWLNGKTEIPELAKKEIESVAQKNIFV